MTIQLSTQTDRSSDQRHGGERRPSRYSAQLGAGDTKEAAEVAPLTMPRHITVVALADRRVDQRGFAPGGEYSERCYLPLLGPTSWLLYRRLAPLAGAAETVDVDLVELAQELGVRPRLGRHDVLAQSLARLATFGLAQWRTDADYAVTTRLRALKDRQAARLPRTACDYHARAVHRDIGT